MATEYRVVWQREGMPWKYRRYVQRPAALKFMMLFGPEPWAAWGVKDGNSYFCCSGYQCSCQGITVRENEELKRKEMPPVVMLRLERREVGQWEEANDE